MPETEAVARCLVLECGGIDYTDRSSREAFLRSRLEARGVSGVLESKNRSLAARRMEIARIPAAKGSSRVQLPALDN